MNGESKIWGVSARGWLVFVVIATECTLALLQVEIPKPIEALGLIGFGYFFGQKGVGK